MGCERPEKKRKDASTEKEQIVDDHGLDKYLRRFEMKEDKNFIPIAKRKQIIRRMHSGYLWQ